MYIHFARVTFGHVVTRLVMYIRNFEPSRVPYFGGIYTYVHDLICRPILFQSMTMANYMYVTRL